MSVLHLLGTAGDGGAETYFVDLVAALKRAGVDEVAAIRAHASREAALTTTRSTSASSPFGTRPRIAGPSSAR